MTDYVALHLHCISCIALKYMHCTDREQYDFIYEFMKWVNILYHHHSISSLFVPIITYLPLEIDVSSSEQYPQCDLDSS